MKQPLLTLTLISAIFFLPLTISFASEQAPNVSLPTLQGKTVALGELKGQVVYVDFWATWCPPCRKSFPWMEQMHQRYKDLGLHIVAISLDQKRDIIDRFLKNHTASFTILHDTEGSSAEAFKVRGMPSSYLIDRQGNLRLSHEGFNDADKPKLERKIKQLLSE